MTQQPPSLETLGDYVALFWRHRIVVASVSIAAAVVAGSVSMLAPRVYQSTVTFAATPSKIGDGWHLPSNASAFRPMVESLATAAAVIEELKLPVSPSLFLRQVMSVAEVRGTSLMVVTASDPTADGAARIANTIAQHAVANSRRVAGSEATHASEMIRVELEAATIRLRESEQRLLTARQTLAVEALRAEVELRLGGPRTPTTGGDRAAAGQLSVVLAQPDSDNRGLVAITSELAGERARLAEVERAAGAMLPGDPARSALAAQVVQLRAGIAAIERQREALLERRPLDRSTQTLMNQLSESEITLGRLRLELEIAQRAFQDLSQKYQEARLQVTGRSAEFVIIDPAATPDRPVSRHVARNSAILGAIGLLLACAGVLVRDSLSRRSLAVR